MSDENGNPLLLAGGIGITVSTHGGSVAVAGNMQIPLRDARQKRWTRFSFQLLDAAPRDSLPPQPVVIKISLAGPKGDEEATVSGMADQEPRPLTIHY